MLIRVTHGTSGADLEEYLEHGHKQGREFTRDELDHRVHLTGDDLNTVARLIDASGRGYHHITLGFKERDLDTSSMTEILHATLKNLFPAFDPDEYMVHAEAHVPKIESYINSSTGEEVERMFHIHVIVPNHNLVSGQALNPFGLVEDHLDYIDAAQEDINNRFGLASPKDNPRWTFNLQSERIARHEELDPFTGDAISLELRERTLSQVMNAVLDRGIRNYADFRGMLAEFGEVKDMKTHGRPILAVRLPGEAKFIRLKEMAFSEAAIALSTEEKYAHLNREIKRQYVERQQARRNPDHIDQKKQEWAELVQPGIRYFNSGNKPAYEAFRSASPEGKRALLAERKARWEGRFRQENHDADRSGQEGAAAQQQRERIYRGHTPESGPRGAGGLAGYGLHELSECRMARYDGGQGTEGLLSPDARADDGATDGLRRRAPVTYPLPASAHIGALLDHGAAPYRRREGGSPSYFVRYQDDAGKEREVWGVDLAGALEELHPAIGERIALVNNGRVAVDIKEPMLDADGNQVGFTTRRTHRNEWVALPAPEAPGAIARPDGDHPALTPEEAAQAAEKAAAEAERLARLREAGEQIIEAPETVIERLTETQSVFTRRKLEKYLREHTADDEQFERVWSSVLASPLLVGLEGEDRGDARDRRIVGELVARGAAPFEHQKGGSPSYFVRYRDDNGEERDVWGVELRAALDKLDPSLGQRIAITHEGRQLVTYRIPVRDEQGNITSWTDKQRYKNLWNAEDAPRQATGNLFTSTEVLAIERRLIEIADRLADGMGASVSRSTHDRIAAQRGFVPEQAEAFTKLVSGEQIAIVNGAAGTGKSYVLGAMREAYEADGFTVIGGILQGKTAKDLERESGIKSQTLASLLHALDNGRVTLDARTVVVVDEAGMVGSRQLERLLSHVEKTGARVRLVGDAMQLHAVDYGDAFARLSDRIPPVRLVEIQRQKRGGAWMCEASKALSRHEVGAAIKAYADAGMVNADKTHDHAKLALVERWNLDRLSTPEKSQIVLARTRAEVAELNLLMREKLRDSGHLGTEHSHQTASGKLALAEGEHIVFLENNRDLGVFNGTAGTIQRIKGSVLTVRLQEGQTVNVDLAEYNQINYGYALTVHKSQGATVDRAYSLVSPGMTAENAYVSWTRHREHLQVFYGQDKFRSLDVLARRLSNPEIKEFSGDYEQSSMSLADQLLDEARREQEQQAETQLDEWKEIRTKLDGSRLLAHLSHSHGTLIDQYEVVKHELGHDLIRCGSRNYSLNDFLTKQLRLDWKSEAAPVLREVYAAQLADVDVEARHVPNKILWESFSSWRSTDWPREVKDAWRTYETSIKERRQAIHDAYKAGVERLKAEYGTGRGSGYKTELSVLRAQRAFRLTELNVSQDIERDALHERYAIRSGEQYRLWLERQVEQGNEQALAELRRQTLRDAGAASPYRDSVSGERLTAAARAAAPMIRDITYSVNRYGDVTYRLAGKDLLVDENKRVRYIDHDPATIEAGLRLSIQKFGTTLHVRGDEDFKRRVVQVSIERGLRIQFSNPDLAAYAKEYEAQLKAQKSVSSAAQSTDLAAQEQAAAQQIGERADNPRSFEQFKQQVQDEARRRAELERQENERQKTSNEPDQDDTPGLD
ncbi:AAA family ATPase [Paraburkholderia kururiensis]|uniref:AAA family ATPase n=1 Tax=Paraburkholderia kururiensis TaxID=984307 RepID=A0ABZ0WVK7_9BURK|nr:AAA family ATPase [Paraburkholderia kururiensis]WQD81259.1 AAA family ATPase [Paraburkholderia kururiensis]